MDSKISLNNAIDLAKNLATCSLDEFNDAELSLIANAPMSREQVLTALVQEAIDQGEALLDIGTDRDGKSLQFTKEQFEEYMTQLTDIADRLNASVSLIHTRHTFKFGSNTCKDEEPFYYAHILIRRRNVLAQDILESRVAVVGNLSPS